MSTSALSAAARNRAPGALPGLCIAGLLLLLAAPPSTIAADQVELLRRAQSAFDQAVNVSARDEAAARRLFADSAAAYRALLDGGLRNAALEYNTGNAFYRAGELARGILHLRRAQRLAPADEDVAANLKHMRADVAPQITSTTPPLIRSLFDWHTRVSPRVRWWTALLAGGAGWALLLAWLRRRNNGLLTAAVCGVVLGAAASASLLWQLHAERHTPAAVVVASQQPLRIGRGEGYDPALREPLGPGVELRVLDTRGGWVRVQLASGLEGWLPDSAIERI